MNQPFNAMPQMTPPEAQVNSREFPHRDPLHATTGLLWGTLMGSAFWLSALTVVCLR